MTLDRRAFLGRTGRTVLGGAAAALLGDLALPAHLLPRAGAATWRKRLTGADLDTFHRWRVAGTDLGIPYVLENGSVGYLFGDTYDSPFPEGPALPNDWLSPVLLRSASHPVSADGIVFDGAAGVAPGADGRTPELFANGHYGPGIDGVHEVTVIPNDGIAFPETGEHVVSYMSMRSWDAAGPLLAQFASGYAGLAWSADGEVFTRTPLKWWNDDANTDPFQMWTMQRFEDFVYVYSVRSGRQRGPMLLRRVPWDRMLEPEAYEGYGWDGVDWGWGRPCSPILEGWFGEPSVRRLDDGTWVMAYLNPAIGCIVTRTAPGPDQAWSDEQVQVGFWQEPGVYGGFVHPWSTREPGGLHLLVSKWSRGASGESTAYHVSQYTGTV
ncbi:MAG TPA: DUF4185 domain-containing protein [Acidimicrobiia bacterium]|nr:DUF4185 domain-containing protein [Acidimicrobiia bacterium]